MLPNPLPKASPSKPLLLKQLRTSSASLLTTLEALQSSALRIATRIQALKLSD